MVGRCEYTVLMSKIIDNSWVSGVLCLAAAMAVGCGNKGDLYLDTPETLLQEFSSIDDALDELELLEAEEEKKP